MQIHESFSSPSCPQDGRAGGDLPCVGNRYLGHIRPTYFPREGDNRRRVITEVKVASAERMRPAMPAVELELEFDAEAELVRIWRDGGARAGRLFGPEASRLADLPYVDLHLATDLLRRGCPPSWRSRSSSSSLARRVGRSPRVPELRSSARSLAPESVQRRVLDVGPVQIHAYGLMLLLGIIAATWVTGGAGPGVGVGATRAGSRPPRRHVGRRRRASWARGLPRRHELERGARRVVGAVRRLEGRPRGLGRHRRRRHRRRDGRAPRAARASTPSWTRSLPGSCSRRRSAAGATGSTRSSSASRPTCPWALEISPENRPRGVLRAPRRSTRRSSTSRSGACSGSASSCSSTSASTMKPPGSSASTCSGTAFGRFGRSSCASTRRTSTSGCA